MVHKKLVIASGTYPPQLGGMATFVKNIATLMHNQGYDITVVAYGDSDKSFLDPYKVVLVSRKRSLFSRYVRYFQTLQQEAHEAKVVYAQGLISSGIPATVLSMFTGKKLMLRLGGDFLWEKMVQQGVTDLPVRDYYKQRKNWKEKIYMMIYKSILDRCQAVIYNSELQKNLFKDVFKVERNKVFVSPNVGSMQTVDKKKQENRKEIVFAGRFVRLKNLKLLLRAYSHLKTDRKLILIGEGLLEPELKKLVSELDLDSKVEFRYPMEHSELQKFFGESFLVVVPSLTEFNPYTALEAISVGTPVLLTSENGLIEEIVSKLVTFNPKSEQDLLQKMNKFSDPNFYQHVLVQQKSIEFSYTWDKVLALHEEIFKKIL